eukprot:TRINITY_DN4831_c0_g1_i4.p1 TRINITY_DN4831_c0_g1~~TRINITY_DN4831_c0_g1_i4.p1  ORF type:complete len:408 (+),score=-18.02 TRINITY_DN4831_c0_g1_i4:572-1795(+)
MQEQRWAKEFGYFSFRNPRLNRDSFQVQQFLLQTINQKQNFHSPPPFLASGCGRPFGFSYFLCDVRRQLWMLDTQVLICEATSLILPQGNNESNELKIFGLFENQSFVQLLLHVALFSCHYGFGVYYGQVFQFKSLPFGFFSSLSQKMCPQIIMNVQRSVGNVARDCAECGLQSGLGGRKLLADFFNVRLFHEVFFCFLELLIVLLARVDNLDNHLVCKKGQLLIINDSLYLLFFPSLLVFYLYRISQSNNFQSSFHSSERSKRNDCAERFGNLLRPGNNFTITLFTSSLGSHNYFFQFLYLQGNAKTPVLIFIWLLSGNHLSYKTVATPTLRFHYQQVCRQLALVVSNGLILIGYIKVDLSTLFTRKYLFFTEVLPPTGGRGFVAAPPINNSLLSSDKKLVEVGRN